MLPVRFTLLIPHNSEFIALLIGDSPLNPSTTGKASAVISALAAGGRSRLTSCGAYSRPSGVGATVLRCCQGRTRAPHPVRLSPMTAPLPCGMGQPTGQMGTAALRPARNNGHCVETEPDSTSERLFLHFDVEFQRSRSRIIHVRTQYVAL